MAGRNELMLIKDTNKWKENRVGRERAAVQIVIFIDIVNLEGLEIRGYWSYLN